MQIKTFARGGQGLRRFTFPAKGLSVSKAFDEEASPIIYGENGFKFDNLYDCYYFLRTIGPKRSKYIQNLEVYYFDMRPIRNFLEGSGVQIYFQEFLALHCPALGRLHFNLVPKCAKTDEWQLAVLEDINSFTSLVQCDSRAWFTGKHPYSSPHSLTLCSLHDAKGPDVRHLS